MEQIQADGQQVWERFLLSNLRLVSVYRMLTDPYYRGLVQFQGVTYKGTHAPIVQPKVWYQVQTVLDTNRSAADATQIHDNYLRGPCSVANAAPGCW